MNKRRKGGIKECIVNILLLIHKSLVKYIYYEKYFRKSFIFFEKNRAKKWYLIQNSSNTNKKLFQKFEKVGS